MTKLIPLKALRRKLAMTVTPAQLNTAVQAIASLKQELRAAQLAWAVADVELTLPRESRAASLGAQSHQEDSVPSIAADTGNPDGSVVALGWDLHTAAIPAPQILALRNREVIPIGPAPLHWDAPWIVRNLLPRGGLMTFVMPPDAELLAFGFAVSLLAGRASLLGTRAEEGVVVRQVLVHDGATSAELQSKLQHAAWDRHHPTMELLEVPLSGILAAKVDWQVALRLLLKGLAAHAGDAHRPVAVHLPVDGEAYGDKASQQALCDSVTALRQAGHAVVLHCVRRGKASWMPPTAFGNTVVDIQRLPHATGVRLHVVVTWAKYGASDVPAAEVAHRAMVGKKCQWVPAAVLDADHQPMNASTPPTQTMMVAPLVQSKGDGKPTKEGGTTVEGTAIPRRGPGRPKIPVRKVEGTEPRKVGRPKKATKAH